MYFFKLISNAPPFSIFLNTLHSCEQNVFSFHYILANISYCQALKSFSTWCTKMLSRCVFILLFWFSIEVDHFSYSCWPFLYLKCSYRWSNFLFKKIGFWLFLQLMQHWRLLLQRPAQIAPSQKVRFNWNGFLHLLSITLFMAFILPQFVSK